MISAKKILLSILAIVGCALLLSCAEPPEKIHKKLDVILQSDLKYIVAEIEKGSGKTYLLDKPYFIVNDLRFFQGDTARKFGAYAEVNYYYFKDIAMFQKRKYRYDTGYRSWDRYFKKLMSMQKPAVPFDSANSQNFAK